TAEAMWQHPGVSTESTRAVVQDYYAALRKGDRARLKELLAPDAVLIPPPSSSAPRRESAEAIIDLLCGGSTKETFDFSKPFNLEIRRVVADGDVAVVQ